MRLLHPQATEDRVGAPPLQTPARNSARTPHATRPTKTTPVHAEANGPTSTPVGVNHINMAGACLGPTPVEGKFQEDLERTCICGEDVADSVSSLYCNDWSVVIVVVL